MNQCTALLALCEGIPLVDSPHKAPVIQKACPCDGVTMFYSYLVLWDLRTQLMIDFWWIITPLQFSRLIHFHYINGALNPCNHNLQVLLPATGLTLILA